MLKQLLAAAVIVLWSYLTPVAAGGELSIQVQSFPPGQPLKPGTAVLLSVEGLEPGQTATWHRVAVEGDVVLQLDGYHLFAGTASGPRTFIVQVASPGADPFTIATFDYGEGDGDDEVNPPVPPLPSEVAGVLILEEQRDRTSAQRKIMDDPVWQSLCLLQGISYQIEDDDNPIVAKHLAAAGSVRPVVLLIDGDGKVIETRAFPGSVEAMRILIGAVK